MNGYGSSKASLAKAMAKFGAVSAGFEYTLFQVSDSDVDLGLLAELHKDGRDELNTPSTVFDNDLFLGMRLALNDIDDMQALLGGIVDLKDGSTSLSLEASSRLTDTLKIKLKARFLVNVDESNSLAPLKRDSFLNFNLIRYF